ncbi:MAG: 1-acyl-sn-glycerol-3-phosphate acyltransferase [Acidimicrobiia bacterium]
MRSLAELARVDHVHLPFEPPCPEGREGHRTVFLLDAATGLEETLLRAWLERCLPRGTYEVHRIAPTRIRRPGRDTDPRLAPLLSGTELTWVVPLRVVWMPAERHGRRAVSWFDVLKLGDPRDPRWFRDYWILARHPDRVRIVVGEGASNRDLLAAQARSVEYGSLADFVVRRAWRALDRAERAERGNRYKIPRFVAEDIVSRPSFRSEAIELGARRGLPEPVALARARYYVREIAASHSPYVIDLIANLIHWVIRQGYGYIHYDRFALDRITELGEDYPLVFLPSHKSNLDRLSLQFMLWENDLPPNHTAGGINMNFFPIGPLVRRTGVFFIRRTFRDNELYKFVVRTYLDYLIEKRFPLEWYMEGGRSRSGKLRPPRYGMLAWVVDSFARGKADDVYLLPVSIAYDHIQEVGAYVTEATGGAKERESFSWALKFARNLRRRYGDIYIRFAEPISMAGELAAADLTDESPIEVQKLAFEVMHRIASVTPITPTAMVATVFLSAKGEPRDAGTITAACRELAAYVRRRRLPTTVNHLPSDGKDVARTMSLMGEHGLISSHSAAGRTLYWMDADQSLRASYYSNSVEHFFVPRGLAEVSLAAPDLDSFWSDIFDLRDLFKFEFFFAEKAEFRTLVSEDLTDEHPDWESLVEGGKGTGIRLRPSTVGWTVLPLLESYLVVADELAGTAGEVDPGSFPDACLERGRLYLLEGRIRSDESVSKVPFGGALLLAENRGLTGTGPEVMEARAQFADELSRYLAAANRIVI